MKLYYSPYFEGSQSVWEHPLHQDVVYIPPQRVLEYDKKLHEEHIYWDCPAWKNYWNNSWVVFNQIDFKFEWDKTLGKITKKSFGEPKTDYIRPEQIKNGDGLVFGLPQQLLIWLPNKEKNIWIEMIPYTRLFHQTGLEYLSSEFPLSRWHKQLAPRFKAHATTISLKRGDPLYVIRFKGGDNYSLQRWKDIDPPEWLRVKFHQHNSLDYWVKDAAWNLFRRDT